MKKGALSELSGTGKFGILLLIIFVSVLVFAFIGGLVGYLITGIGISDSILADYSNPDTIVFMKISQIFQAIGIFIIPPFIALFLFKKGNENYLNFRNTKLIFIALSALSMIVALPIINYLAEINQALVLPESLSGLADWMHKQEENAANITQYFLKADNVLTLLLNLFVMALIPAIGEELLFRGVILKLFKQMSKNTHIAIWTTAFLFSAIHMQFFTFLPRFFMGALFGYLLVWSGSIWLPITAHFVNNGFAVVTNYLYQNKITDTDMENIEVENPFYYIILSIIIISVILYYIRNSSKNIEVGSVI